MVPRASEDAVYHTQLGEHVVWPMGRVVFLSELTLCIETEDEQNTVLIVRGYLALNDINT